MQGRLNIRMLQFSLIYIVIVISFFDNFSHIPIMSPFATSLGASIFLASIIVSAYSMSNMIGNFYAGIIIEKFGRTGSMTLGLLFSAIIVLGYSIVTTPNQLLQLRIFHGLGMAVVIPAAFTLIGDLSTEDSRGQDMAKSGIAISVAALLGPPIGGLIKTYIGLQYLFYFATFLLIMGSVISKFLIKETVKGETILKQPEEAESKTERSRLINLAQPELLIAYLAALLLMIAKGTLVFALPLHSEELGFSASTTGILFSSFAVSAILIFATPLNRLSDKKGRYAPIIIGLIVIAISLGLLSFGSRLIELIPVMLLYGIGFGILFPACTALIVDHTDKKDRGKGFGIFYGVFSMGVVVGPIVSGALAQWLNPFLTASLLVFFGLVPVIGLFHRVKSSSIPPASLSDK